MTKNVSDRFAAWKSLRATPKPSDKECKRLLVLEKQIEATPALSLGEIRLKVQLADVMNHDGCDSQVFSLLNSIMRDVERIHNRGL